MKYLRIIAAVFSIGLFLQVYGYINLMVSYKDEVDIMETHVKVSEEMSAEEKLSRYNRIDERKQEIVHQQKVIKVLFWVFLIGLIIVLYFLYFKNKFE